MKKKRKISWRGARSWRQLWGHLRQNFHNFTTFWKSEKKGKNELELTSKLTSPPTKVFTSGKTSYTKTSLKKSPKLNRFFTKSCSLSFFSLKSSNQPYLKFPYFFKIVLLEVPKIFFLQKNRSKTPFDPPFLARHLSQGRTNSKSQCGATIWAYAKRAGFLTPPWGLLRGGNIDLGWGNRHFNSL